MTAPIVHRPLRRAGRKPSSPPAGAADQVRELAADGWSIVGISYRLGVDRKTFERWLARDPMLREAIELGREHERWTLCNALYRRVTEHGDVRAAEVLLRARHGLGSNQSDQARAANITIALPGSMTMQQFLAVTAPGGTPAIEAQGADQNDRRTERSALPA